MQIKPSRSSDEKQKQLVGSKKKIDSKYIQIIQIPTNRFDEQYNAYMAKFYALPVQTTNRVFVMMSTGANHLTKAFAA